MMEHLFNCSDIYRIYKNHTTQNLTFYLTFQVELVLFHIKSSLDCV